MILEPFFTGATTRPAPLELASMPVFDLSTLVEAFVTQHSDKPLGGRKIDVVQLPDVELRVSEVDEPRIVDAGFSEFESGICGSGSAETLEIPLSAGWH